MNILSLVLAVLAVLSPAENVDIKHLIINIINTNERNFHSLIIAINGHGLPFLL